MRDPAVALLLRLLDESYRKSAWQGPNLKGSLRGVDASQAVQPLMDMIDGLQAVVEAIPG